MYDIFILLLFSLVLAAYLWLLLYTSYSWKYLKNKSKVRSSVSLPISIILPFRNEESKLTSFLDSIKKQKYDPTLFELVAVNDHSEDNGPELIKTFIEHAGFNVRLVELEDGEFSKKAALKKGIEQSKGELIITTDADTSRGEYWLQSIASEFDNSNVEMLIAPVLLTGKSSFIQSFQMLEFIALQYISLCFAGRNNAVLCNGANLAYKRSAFEALSGFSDNITVSSGDDVFLMHQLKKVNRSAIGCSIDSDSIVSSQSVSNWKDLIDQKIRWAGKSTHIKDRTFVFLSLLLVATNALLVLLPIMEYGNDSWPILSLALICAKFLVDLIMIQRILRFYKTKIGLLVFFTSFILYPFYLVAILILSRFYKPTWKGRTIRT